jgi:hypothetical protein
MISSPEEPGAAKIPRPATNRISDDTLSGR